MGKRQHYLSQFYLRGFSTNYISSHIITKSKEKVWCYSEDSRNILNISIKNIGFRNNYFSFKSENGIIIDIVDQAIQLLENQVAPIIKLIDSNVSKLQTLPVKERKNISIKQLTTKQKHDLIRYLIFYMNMNPKLRDKLTERLYDLEFKFLKENSLGEKRPSTKKVIIETLLNIGTDKKMHFFNTLVQKRFFVGFYPKATTSFITTDNPVVRFRKDGKNGIIYDDTEIYLPLTQRCILMLVDKDNDVETYFPIPDKKRISEFNKLIASNFYKLIIGRDKRLVEIMADSVKK